ncbi:MAG: efflux RND transporter permease subunit [Proteobacteria bacterium]|nr:efflux RND transporter permease subunit [Pseudomonadota bacterium]
MLASLLERGTLLTVAALVFCVLAIAAALRMPVQMIPDLEVRTISVRTGWPGATPQDVEKEILIEQERYLRSVPNLTRMVSRATTGAARIELEFPYGVDVNEALIRVNNALSQVSSYPENVDEPSLSSTSFSANAFIYFRLTARGNNPLALNLYAMRDFAEDEIRPRLERVPGVAEAEVGGGAAREIRVEVDPARLAERGLSLGDVRDALRARNRDVSAGDIDSGKRRYLVRTVGRFEQVEDVADVILARRGDAIVRLRDVADVSLGLAELRDLSYTRGVPTLSFSLHREPGSNVIAIKRAVLPVIAELNDGLLAENGLELTLVSDDVRYVQDSVTNVFTNLAIGSLLATLVLFLFLRSAGATLIGILGIPICALAAFLGLLLTGRTLNVISLAGIAFAIGMTLDNTIVVLENIEQARRRGLTRFDAAVAGVREVWTAVLASTLTTILVFAPILFIEEEAGQLYSDIAIAISAAILASMVVAVTLVPAAIARRGFGGRAQEAPAAAGMLAACTQRIDWLIATPGRRWSCIGTASLVVSLTLFFLTPPAEYLPEGEEPKVFANMIAPPGYNLAEMAAIADQVNARLAPRMVGTAEQAETGPSNKDFAAAAVPLLQTLNLSVSPQRLRVMAEPRDAADVDQLMTALNALFREYPGMRSFASRGSIISSNDGGTRSVNVDVSGPDLAELYAAADALYLRAGQMFEGAQIGSDPSSLSLDQPLLQISPRWERLAELGLTTGEFGYAVSALSDGAFVGEFFEGDDKIDIKLYSGAGSRQTVEQLRQLPVFAPSGAVLPLDAVAELRETVDTDVIRRVDGRRTVTLNIVAPREIALESAVALVATELLPGARRDGLVPASVSLAVSGAADQLDATRAALSGNFLIAVLLCYLLLVAIFVHWGYPLLILATVPVGLAGGMIGLAAMNLVPGVRQPFDVITMLGFLILLGTVVNNPILIVDRTRQNLLRGGAVLDAVSEAVASRIRPVLMTTLTTVFGLAPLVFLPGAGTELYRGLGVVVLAGLVSATLVTLTVLPCLLVILLGRPRRVAAT